MHASKHDFYFLRPFCKARIHIFLEIIIITKISSILRVKIDRHLANTNRKKKHFNGLLRLHLVKDFL